MPTIDNYPAAASLTGIEVMAVSQNGETVSLSLPQFVAWLQGQGVAVTPGNGSTGGGSSGGGDGSTNHILGHDDVSRTLTRTGAFLTFR